MRATNVTHTGISDWNEVMTLANGTIVAATTPQQDVMRMVLGITPSYGKARVLGTAPTPAELEAVDFRGDVYVVEPLDDETDSVPEGLEDVAYEVATDPNMPRAVHPQIGVLSTAVILQKVSKSEFLAAVETKNTAVLDQFRAELEGDLFQFAEQADDEADPEFLDDGTGTTP